MTDDLKKGDRVTWNASGKKAEGTVVRRLTEPMEIKGHHVAASEDNREYLVETDEGAQAAHKPGALTKVG